MLNHDFQMLLCTALNKCTCETQNFDPQTRLSPPRWPPWRSAVLHSLCSKGGNSIQIWSLLPPRSIFVLVKVENRKRCLLKQFVIQTFLQEEILMAINSLQRSPVYGHDTDFTALLGIAFNLLLHLHPYIIFAICAPRTRFVGYFLLHTKACKSRQNGFCVKTAWITTKRHTL